jgi:hypothetical protein
MTATVTEHVAWLRSNPAAIMGDPRPKTFAALLKAEPAYLRLYREWLKGGHASTVAPLDEDVVLTLFDSLFDPDVQDAKQKYAELIKLFGDDGKFDPFVADIGRIKDGIRAKATKDGKYSAKLAGAAAGSMAAESTTAAIAGKAMVSDVPVTIIAVAQIDRFKNGLYGFLATTTQNLADIKWDDSYRSDALALMSTAIEGMRAAEGTLRQTAQEAGAKPLTQEVANELSAALVAYGMGISGIGDAINGTCVLVVDWAKGDTRQKLANDFDSYYPAIGMTFLAARMFCRAAGVASEFFPNFGAVSSALDLAESGIEWATKNLIALVSSRDRKTVLENIGREMAVTEEFQKSYVGKLAKARDDVLETCSAVKEYALTKSGAKALNNAVKGGANGLLESSAEFVGEKVGGDKLSGMRLKHMAEGFAGNRIDDAEDLVVDKVIGKLIDKIPYAGSVKAVIWDAPNDVLDNIVAQNKELALATGWTEEERLRTAKLVKDSWNADAGNKLISDAIDLDDVQLTGKDGTTHYFATVAGQKGRIEIATGRFAVLDNSKRTRWIAQRVSTIHAETALPFTAGDAKLALIVDWGSLKETGHDGDNGLYFYTATGREDGKPARYDLTMSVQPPDTLHPALAKAQAATPEQLAAWARTDELRAAEGALKEHAQRKTTAAQFPKLTAEQLAAVQDAASKAAAAKAPRPRPSAAPKAESTLEYVARKAGGLFKGK